MADNPLVPESPYAAYGNPRAPGWESANLVTITAPGGVKFRVNRYAAPAFQGFLNDLASTGYKINPSESGGFNLRNVTGGTTLSPHAYGLAVDVNWNENPYSKTPEGGMLRTDLPPEVGQLAAKWGLQWGGNWKSLKDPMHFEYDKPPPTTEAAEKWPWTTDNALAPTESAGNSLVASNAPAPEQGQAPSNQLVPAPSRAPQTPEEALAQLPPAPSPQSGTDPIVALKLLELLLPKTHTFQPVDYDPWAIQRLGAKPHADA
jgi:hypothetical protein